MSGGDPLADPRASELLKANADEISSLAAMLNLIADQAGKCITGTRIISQADWSGPAHSATLSSIDSMTPGLQAIGEAYRQAGHHLTAYANVVSTEQPIFKNLKQQLETTQSTISRLTSLQQTQSTTLGEAEQYKSQDGPTLTKSATKQLNHTISGDAGDLRGTTNALTSAQGTLGGLQFQGMNILNTFSTARTAASTAIRSLGDQAPQESWEDKLLGDVGHWAMMPVHFVEGIAVDTFDAFKDLPSDVSNLVTHFDLKNLEKFGEDAGTVLSTLALATGGGEILAGLADADRLEELMGGATKGLEKGAAGSLGTSGAAAAAGGNWKDAAKDFALLALPASRGLANTEASAEDVLAAREAYADALRSGQTPGEAFTSLTAEQQNSFEIADGVAAVPITQAGADGLVTAAKGDARSAAKNMELKGRTGDKVVEHGVNQAVDGDESDNDGDKGSATTSTKTAPRVGGPVMAN